MKKTEIGRAVAFRLPARTNRGAKSFPVCEPFVKGPHFVPQVVLHPLLSSQKVW